MAALGSEVPGAWLQVWGVAFSFMLLLLLAVFLTALCSQCSRRSFELGDFEEDSNPSTLIRTAKLEEAARENPMMEDIQRDERDAVANGGVDVAAAVAAASASDSDTSAEVSVPSWRSHLMEPPSSDPAHSRQIGSISAGGPPPRTNEEPGEEGGVAEDGS